ncbi:unnamed protein product [Victoria cruziana]
MMSEMEKATATATPPRKSSSALRNKELFDLQPPPLQLDVTPTPHPTPKVSPCLAAAVDALPESHHHQEQMPAPHAVLSPSSSTRRSRRGLARQRHKADRLSSSSSTSLLPLPSGLCIDDPLLDSPTLRPRKWKNGCSPGGRASPVAQRSGRRVSRRAAAAAAAAALVIEKEEKDFGDVSAREDRSPTKKAMARGFREKERCKNGLGGCHDINRVGRWLYELIMWKDIARSSLWFGLGSLCFLASAFAKGFSFSFVSVTSDLALLCLAVVFFYSSFARREKDGDYEASESGNKLAVRQEDITYAVQMLVSMLNVIISKIRELFSGDPSMTLKVAPVLFIASEYGHLLSLWRLFAAGFFLSFTIPKMYSRYAEKLHTQVSHFRSWMLEAWTGCGHKRILATSATTIFWNVSSMKTRFFAVFMFVVLLRFYRQFSQSKNEAGNGNVVAEEVAEEEALDKNR